ncbi:unnamed protein product [Mesocestoides corti]|uniref:PDEase domain-containing protein n=1 Tax=Mesocestoides corti TaxID=53468 RepID=A0A0R3UC24_MESCO|nr:unnamed protein product [Mesocestoides corti]
MNAYQAYLVFREATASGEGATAAVSSHPSLRLPLLPSAGSLCRPPADRNWIHHHLHHHAHPATTASAPPHRCPPVPARPIAPSDVPMQEDGLAAFLSTVDAALGACDVVTPGVRTGAPPNPSLSSIRQSRETCLAVWQEFYLSRRNSLPAEVRLQLRQPTFNNWSHSDAQLLRFVRFFFTGDTTDSELCDERLQLTRLCGIPEEVLDAWLCVVYANYNAVQFHNFKHAFMVTQMVCALPCSAFSS